jgi:xanthine dehydrogenase accessory factor
MDDAWFMAGLEDDMRPRMFAAAARGEAFALVTITAAEGGGPRGVGSQMVITSSEAAGFLSGGCIETDVAIHARATLKDGTPRRIVYGRGSPFVDTRLPCGGRLELLIERIEPDDPALADLNTAALERRAGTYASDGVTRSFGAELDGPAVARVGYAPVQRLVVVGGDPFALAIADLGVRQAWEVTLVRPKGPDAPPPLAVVYDRSAPAEALAKIDPDAWTAIAIATHDSELDHEALLAALPSAAGYVGMLGARRRLPERLARLAAAGIAPEALARLKAPIGLALGAANPVEIAVSVIAEIIETRRARR